MVHMRFSHAPPTWKRNGISRSPFKAAPIQRLAKKISNDPHYEAKNKTFYQTFKNRTIRRVLTGGFQIWSQKSNRENLTPFWRKTVKI